MNKCAVTVMILILAVTLGGTALASPAGDPSGLVVDRSTRSKALNDYVVVTRDAIQRAWTKPVDLAIPEALKARVRVTYTIKADGRLERVDLVQGSGNLDLDQGLVQAIRDASPFPRLPHQVNGARITIRANFIVADLPVVPATTVDLKLSGRGETSAAIPAPQGARKYIWGVPAGSAFKRERSPEEVVPERPQVKTYQWGLP